jgi:hypothetical protein
MATYEQLETWFSAGRLASYEVAAGGDRDLALRLYEWNAEVSAAFMCPLHHAEVLLRNRIHDVMTAAYPDNPEPWFKQDNIFVGEKGPRLIAEAVDRLKRDKADVTTGRIIASVSFGFWNGLFVRSYSNLWAQTLNRCFAEHGPRKRERVVEATESIKIFRNRLAHHERIIQYDLRARHDDLVKLAMWIDPEAREWILGQSKVLELLGRRPRSN